MHDENLVLALEIMEQFAEDSGLLDGREPQRYLWTDAFAVCNYLELHRLTGEEKFRGLAVQLVDQVHHVLGRHRQDDPRSGWISGLSDDEGEEHPTRGGLRIGKKLRERQEDEAENHQLEWERDGQYFHYLTKWMHALHQVSARTGESRYDDWARELAVAAHRGFTYRPSFGAKRMYWKMSIDLSRPLVMNMGQHDPLDGYLSFLELQDDSAVLAEEIADMEAICRRWNISTDDPLGIGGLLADALRLVQFEERGKKVLDGLLANLLGASRDGLAHFIAQNGLHYPLDYRLAFRELGLAIGLKALPYIDEKLRQRDVSDKEVRRLLDDLLAHLPLAEKIDADWKAIDNRRSRSWTEQQAINAVMLATSLVPAGFLLVDRA